MVQRSLRRTHHRLERNRLSGHQGDDGYADPMNASRALAMMHLAMHDAINAAKPRYASYSNVERDGAADPAVAAVSAAHDVLAALYPKQQSTLLKAALDKSLVDAGTSDCSDSRCRARQARCRCRVAQARRRRQRNRVPYQRGQQAGRVSLHSGLQLRRHSAVARRSAVRAEDPSTSSAARRRRA